MKKFLSLVLALVMTMSLVTVSAGAADFKDSKDINYVEAVEVLDLIGVLEGYPDGSFQPKTVLTRAQAATIIAKLILTPELATELSVEAAPFADVPATHWAAAYIAEGVEQGILAGMGDGTFAPDAQLTGFQFLKMLFVALGYDAVAEGLTGANYTMGVTKLNKELKLTEGNDKFVGKNPVTREEAALYVWNAMNTEQVDYADNGGMTIKVENVVIETNGSADADGNGEFWVESYKLEKYDGEKAEDDFGRAGYFWFIDENTKGYDKKDEKTCTISEAATYVLVAEKAYKATEMDKLLEDNDIEDVDAIDFDGAIAVGTVVELWVEDDAVETVLTYTYEVDFVAEVIEADDDDESDDYEHGITTYYDLTERDETYVDAFECDDDDCTFCEDLIAIGEWEEGDAILFTVNEDGEDVEFAAAESFEGEISSKKGTYVKVDGDKYFTAVAIAFDKEYTFYVDANGIIIEAVEVVEKDEDDDRETEYVYVLDSQFKYDGGEDADLLNEAEEESLTYKVKYMTVDGDVVKADYAAFDKTIDKKTGETALYVEFLGKDVAAADLTDKANNGLKGWYEAAFEGDEIVLVAKADVETEFEVSDAREWADGLRANSDTELVLLDKDGVYKTYTGRTNMPEMTLENAVVVTEKKTVVAIYNYAKEYEAEAVAPVVGMFKALGENVAEGEIEATFVVAGSEETYVIAEAELVKGALYVVTEAADEDELTEVVALADSDIDYIEGTVDFVDGDYFEVGDADLEKADDCAVYQFNKAGDKLSKGTLSTGKKVVVILDSEGDAAEIFQYKA